MSCPAATPRCASGSPCERAGAPAARRRRDARHAARAASARAPVARSPARPLARSRRRHAGRADRDRAVSAALRGPQQARDRRAQDHGARRLPLLPHAHARAGRARRRARADLPRDRGRRTPARARGTRPPAARAPPAPREAPHGIRAVCDRGPDAERGRRARRHHRRRDALPARVGAPRARAHARSRSVRRALSPSRVRGSCTRRPRTGGRAMTSRTLDQLAQLARKADAPALDDSSARRLVDAAIARAHFEPTVVPRRHPLRWAAAGAFAVAAAIALFVLRATPTPATMHLALPTGDVLTGTAGAHFAIAELTPSSRKLRFDTGTIVCDVAHVVAGQHFEVTAGDVTVVATGTVFSVSAAGHVHVYEGSVEVHRGAHLARPAAGAASGHGDDPRELVDAGVAAASRSR